METSNYLPYTVAKSFQDARRRLGGRSNYASFMQRYAHKRARQAMREFLRGNRNREPSKHKFWVDGWEID